jgi:ABC-type branched-subunit amino acid transport system permease subunit
MGFAAIGAVAFSKLDVNAGIPWLPALLIAGLVVVPVGALLAIPAIRLSGLYLALATFGFGLLLADMFYNSNLMFGVTNSGLSEPLPHLSWLSLDSAKGFYYVVLAATALTAVLVVALVRGRLGRVLRAMNDSPTALATSGTSTNVTRVLVFCLSAYIAAIAGAFMGMVLTQVSGDSFNPYQSLTVVAVIMIVTFGEPWNAVVAAGGLALIPAYITASSTSTYLQVLFGVAAVTTALGLQGKMPMKMRMALERFGKRRARPAHEPARSTRDCRAHRHPVRSEDRGPHRAIRRPSRRRQFELGGSSSSHHRAYRTKRSREVHGVQRVLGTRADEWRPAVLRFDGGHKGRGFGSGQTRAWPDLSTDRAVR